MVHARSLTPLAVVGLVFAISSCGGDSSKSSTGGTPAHNHVTGPHSYAWTTQRHLLGDQDDDEPAGMDRSERLGDADADNDHDYAENASKGYIDGDDSAALDYGHAPNTATERKIAAVATRYFVAAARGDGASACSLIVPTMAQAIPEDYGGVAGPSYLRGSSTCAAAMSRLFMHDHAQLASAMKVTGVRIDGGLALALVGSHTVPAGYVDMTLIRGAWRISDLLSTPLP
jgi:hypothetical protein